LQIILHGLEGKIADEEPGLIHVELMVAAQKTQWGDSAPAAVTEWKPFNHFDDTVI
jgi:hypothetical protein